MSRYARRNPTSPCRFLQISTVKTCSMNCYPYCPQLKFREAYGNRADFLSFDDFALALSKTPKDVQITFSGFAEPFLNIRALDMIELARSEGFRVALFSTLVGLRAEKVEKLKDSLDYFCIHLPDDRGIAHIPMNDGHKETLMAAFQTLKIDDYSRMSDEFGFNDRAGSCDKMKHRHVKGPFFCQMLITPQPVMLPDMRMTFCCQDFQLHHIIGDMRTQTFDEITKGEEFKNIAANRWRWDGDTICRSCLIARPLHKQGVYEVYLRGRRWMFGL